MTRRKLGVLLARRSLPSADSPPQRLRRRQPSRDSRRRTHPMVERRVMHRRGDHAAPDSRGHAVRAATGSSRSRTGSPFARAARDGRPLRQPRDVQGSVPVRHRRTPRRPTRRTTSTTRRSAGSILNQHGRGAERLLRHRAARATSGSARTTSRRARKDSSATSSSRTRSRRTTCSGRGARGRPRATPGAEAERARRRARRPDRASTRDLRDGTAQPREQRRRSRGSTTWSCSRATTRSSTHSGDHYDGAA